MSLAATAPFLLEYGVDLHVAYFIEREGVGPTLSDAGVPLHPLLGATSRLGRVHQVGRLVRAIRPNLVHTTLFEADVAGRVGSRLAGVPVVSSLVNEMYGPSHFHEPGVSPVKVRLGWAIDASTARLTRRLHAVSGSVAEVMSERLRIRRDQIDVVPRGRDPVVLGERTYERRMRVRVALGLSEAAPVILTVARQDPQKRIHLLVEALADLRRDEPEAILLVAGKSGNSTFDLQALVTRLGVDNGVRFLGHRTDVPDLLCAADVFASASSREGLPGALIEAMGIGTPSVVTNIPAFREVLQTDEGTAGVLVKDSEVSGFVSGVTRVLQDTPDTDAMVSRARRKFASHYTLEASARGMLQFYERSLAV